MDWRLVEDHCIRNIPFYLIAGPVCFLAGFYEWPLYFLPFVLFAGVGTSIDEFFHMKPYRVIGSLGISKGTLSRTIWFENVILPAAFVALVFWTGAVTEANSIEINGEKLRILWITVLWIFIFQSICLMFCLICESEPASRVVSVTVILICFVMAGAQPIREPWVGWLMVMAALGLISSFAVVRHGQSPSRLYETTTASRANPISITSPFQSLMERAMSHPIGYFCVAIVGSVVFGISYRVTRLSFSSPELMVANHSEIVGMTFDFVFSAVPFFIPVYLVQRWRTAIRVFRSLPMSSDGFLFQILVLNGLLGLVYCILMVLFA
ncbi:MAG: hypothetical protein KC964_18275 [Candidatus Omnitrophica bacterium]|nr:hypothetical protein [Candidatus Omnitrophota bacterium]